MTKMSILSDEEKRSFRHLGFLFERIGGVKMNYEKLADDILTAIGSAENIKDGTHCFTRLRLTIHDTNKIDIEQLKGLSGVIDARFQSGQLQIIIGSEVGKVYEKIAPYITTTKHNEPKQKQSFLDTIFTTIASIFTPILPAIIGAGLMKGILPLLVTLNLLSETSGTYQLLMVVGDTSFNFLPILIAVSASKRFKVNEYLGVTLACSLLYPTILNGEGTMKLFGFISIPLMSYTSTVIPIILGVWAMSYVYRWVDKFVPSVVKMIFTPLLVLLIMIPLTLALFGPLGYYAGQVLATISAWLSENVPFLYGLLLGGLNPLIVMTGMHYAFFPVMLENVSRLGYENGFLPISLFANISMAAATLAIAIKVKNKKEKEVSFSSAISAFFGITEPALYGVVLKYKKVLYIVMFTGGLVNAVMMTMGVKMFTFVTPGILSLSVFINPDGSMTNLLITSIGLVVAVVLAFTLVMFAKIDFESTEKKEVANAGGSMTDEPIAPILSPIAGKVTPLSECSDSVFSQGLMGKGIVIIPNDGEVYAPFDGTITALVDEKHAIGMTSSEGVEVLIHIGIDTVELKGEGYQLMVKKGESVKKGQQLASFDIEKIQDKGYSTEVPIIVTNTPKYFEVVPISEKGFLKVGDHLLTVIN